MPGAPYGGSCLPKDLAALNSMSKKQGLSSPLLGSIAESNKNFYEKLVNNVKVFVKDDQFLIHGISFKNGTDDIRNSPGFNLAIDLLKDNYKFHWFDQDILDTLNEYGFESAFFTQFPLDLLDLMVSDPIKLLDNKEYKIVITKSLCKNNHLEQGYKQNKIFYFSI